MDEIIDVLTAGNVDGGMSSTEINNSLKTALAHMSLNRTLKAMVTSGELVVEGAARATKYYINKKSKPYLKRWFSGNPAERPSANYNFSLLENYKPNKTYLLTEAQLEKLHEVSKQETSVTDRQYRKILNRLIIDLAHSSSTLEGVKISWIDTRVLIDTNLAPEGLSELERNVVLNHKAAIKFLLENDDITFKRKDIYDIHSLLMEDLFKEENLKGSIRSRAVRLGESRYIPLAVESQISEEFEKFIKKALEIKDPFEKAFFCMVFVPYLQPFSDGNRRTSRLISNIPLIQERLSPFSYSGMDKNEYDFALLSFYELGIYDLLADVFIKSYQLTAQLYNELIASIEEGGWVDTLPLDGGDIERKRPSP